MNEELIQRAKRGDDDAFFELMQLHKEKMYRIALSFLHSEQDALEAMQETTYRAYKGLKRLKKNQFFTTWLIRIVMNYCTDELRKRKRTTVQTDFVENSSVEPGFEHVELEALIAQLDVKQQQVIKLKYFHDLKIAEVADVMEVPEGTVKTWLHKALLQLRKQLEMKGEGRHA
ncbi:sigma-70 family RNA polymerase sigma factor [Bacillus sp. HMF5848]|uniref:sigma-70 family RNA polymerase sigma factor n=1 Tax=Bacillus sp. HMF5848 TaxID=2495421 RepID=UPI000F79C2C4|nr:sigma-70 family RNA polymerase sigma factor [Bacillus sp. HMF5848]RSK27736.1 sigma-70 family RNA polymerase sigma factor [Bacillus sp. HMF5848]